MATSVPASLKAADITRFAHRAAQLEKVKPVISYWCNYHIAQQILAKSLHNVDAETLNYTTNLMDELEQYKAQNADNDTVTDDLAGKVYVEQFGLETFSRADDAIRANKATKQTADTFLAAGTFLDLLAIWGPIEPEIAAKIKFAKYHALRILKAIKAGQDPNLSNPQQGPKPEEVLPQLDPNDAEVRALGGVEEQQAHQTHPLDAMGDLDGQNASSTRPSGLDQEAQQYQPSVVEVPDEAHTAQSRSARQSTVDESLHPSRAPSLPRMQPDQVSPLAPQDASSFYTNDAQPDISPIEPSTERKPSIGGNYFPVVAQTNPADQMNTRSMPSEPSLPQAQFPPPQNTLFDAPGPGLPPAPGPGPGNQFQAQPPTSNIAQQSHHSESSHPVQPGQQPGHIGTFSPSQPLPPNTTHTIRQQQQPSYTPSSFSPQPYTPSSTIPQPSIPITNPPPTSSTNTNINATVDEEAIMKAQKHARWAISALNFEDVPTAIRELEGALRILGAR